MLRNDSFLNIRLLHCSKFDRDYLEYDVFFYGAFFDSKIVAITIMEKINA
jgi:hypothetical protein